MEQYQDASNAEKLFKRTKKGCNIITCYRQYLRETEHSMHEQTKEFTREEIENEEWHEIHDEANEDKRDGTLIN